MLLQIGCVKHVTVNPNWRATSTCERGICKGVEGIYVKVAATRGRWSVENRSLAFAHIVKFNEEQK